MTKQFSRTLVTTALPYANGGIHIGHLAGVYIPADIYVRYLRARHQDVLFIGGSDEHGVPITLRAKKEHTTPQHIVDRYHNLIKESFEEFGISFDIYSRTTSATHHQMAADFFRHLYDSGKLTEQTTKQYYDPEAKQFLADRYITGECPHCHNANAYGDQCEKCGKDLDPTQLINPKSTISGAKPELRDTTNWYLPLNEYQAFLEQWILKEHTEWRPNVYGQCKSWLDMQLQPRAMTRDLDWGIPVPIKGAEGKVLYVWFDAPIGYISNTKELLPDTWETWWKDESTRLVHFIGKDNIVFHCIVFPTMLHAHGGYILPDAVPANEFLKLEDDKISTSRNWAVWLDEYLKEMPGKQDTLRYVLTANAPETKDNNFTWHDFQDRHNNELVAVYGNFVNRALQLTKKYFNGVVPPQHEDALTDCDKAALEEMSTVRTRIEQLMDNFKLRDAQFEAMSLARLGNRYITENEPWKQWKTDPQRVETVLNICLQITANLAIAFRPFLPFSSEHLLHMLTLEAPEWEQLGNSCLLKEGWQLGEPALLFEKIDDDAINFQLEKLAASRREHEQQAAAAQAAAAGPKPIAPVVDFDTFAKTDIRVATVKECFKVEKSTKLLQFTLDDGTSQPRTILSGIAKYCKPEDLIGKQVLFVANLAPRKIMGIESQGMILSAEDADGRLVPLTTSDNVAPGSQVG